MSHHSQICIGLVQYNSAHRHYLPYAVGLLQAYAQVHSAQPERYRFLPIRVLAAPLASECEALAEAEIVAFSCYIWNLQRNLALAKALKDRQPECLILFGGPQIPQQTEPFLRQYPQVDLCCVGEGEAPFLALLEDWPQRHWAEIPGLRWLNSGQYRENPAAPRRRDLETLPSPYLEGVFADCFTRYPEQPWSALWETNRGCPFSCSFCDWGSATASKVYRFGMERLCAELDWFAQAQIDFVFCCDANFGILPRDLDLATYAAHVRQETGFPHSLVVQNAKNAAKRTFEVHRILAQAGLDTHATISLQSLHPPTLKASGRENISLADFARLQRQLQQVGIHSYTDIILGLPEETYDSFADGIAATIASGQYQVLHLFTADVLPNAPMAAPAYRQQYGIETVQVPAVGFHTPVQEDPDGIVEFQNLVIATRSLPRPDWVRARVFISMTQLLLFKPGTLRLPLLLLHHAGQKSLRPLIEIFLAPPEKHPVLNWVHAFFEQHARNIQQGQPEHVPGREPNGQWFWWSINEAVLDQLVRKNGLGNYYREAEQLLRLLWAESALPTSIFDDALFFAASLQHLHLHQDLCGLHYRTQWNVWDYYQALLMGREPKLQPQVCDYFKDWRGAPYQLRKRRRQSP